MSSWLLPRVDLTPEQLRVVEMTPGEHRVILGPPGSGKTQILIHRAAHLAETYRVSPTRFRVLVFTNVVKEYIKSGLTFLDLPEEVVTTFDHWCRLFYEQHVSKKLPWRKESRSPDFGKIRTSVLDVLKSKKSLRKHLDFVLVDEGQDLAPQVYEILSLAANHITVFADPQQKIFEDGASEAFIIQQLGLNGRNAMLLGAYRNAPYVAQLASYFIEDEKIRGHYLKQICTQQKIRERPLCYIADTFEQEMDRLAEIIRQRQTMNERVGIIVPKNDQLHGLAKGLKERGVVLEKAIRVDANRNPDESFDFGNDVPKIATYHMAKGLTFDSVLLPRLSEKSFPFVQGTARKRILFVGIARATQWVYMSMLKGLELDEHDILEEASEEGVLTIQRGKTIAKVKPSKKKIEEEESPL